MLDPETGLLWLQLPAVELFPAMRLGHLKKRLRPQKLCE